MKVTTTIVGADATGKTVLLNAEAMGPCYVLWGDGTAEEAMTQTQAPVQETSVMGLYNKQHAYAKDGEYNAVVRTNDARIEVNLLLGKKPFPQFDPHLYTITPAERQRREAERARAILRVKDTIG